MWSIYGTIAFFLLLAILGVVRWVFYEDKRGKDVTGIGIVVVLVLVILFITTAIKSGTGYQKEEEQQEQDFMTEVKKIVGVEKAIVKEEKDGEKEILTEDGVYTVKTNYWTIEYITKGGEVVYIKD